MNYLEICKRARHESRISGDGPTTVTGQLGVLADVVLAVRDAWRELQMMHETWLFLEATAHAELVANGQVYSPTQLNMQSLRRVISIFCGHRQLKQLDWDKYQSLKRSQPRFGAPTFFCVTPSRQVEFYPSPSEAVGIETRYTLAARELVQNSDEPSIPAEYRMIIVWMAVMKLTANESDAVVYQKALEHYDRLLAELQSEFLPAMDFGRGALR
ncbi:hypothetical protein [Aliidiomarina maris]|uniref:Uncharacterized protein n=1 Tax=Aliidiomarina maris TaxID=531312 RepID=A0A327X3S5_9GAMM|nr:hypothetical protein [Aliidiomarina maris]RAK01607.1 hypothetical protein B0I24_101230 [Aliidiomarina maris]RUO28433.1 hypothetical protein CWE07_01100 [Aliidiomarina maris]